MTEPIIEPDQKTAKNKAAVKALENDVGFMWDLTKGSSTLKWNTERVVSLPEKVGRLLIAEPNLPYVGIAVFPAMNGILADRTERIVPVVSGHISNISEHPLRNYEIRKKGRDTNLTQPKTIDAALKEIDAECIKPETQVLDVMAFLPTHPDHYETNFTPIFSSPTHYDGPIGSYALFTFVQDRALNRSMVLDENHWTAVFDDKDGANNAPYFKADSIAQLSAVEKLMLPENKGRMVVAAVPVRRKHIPSFDYFGSGILFSPNFHEGPRLKSLVGPSRSLGRDMPRYPSASADDVDIKTGADSGARLETVEVQTDPSRKTFIYHLRLVGITPEDIKAIKQEQITDLYKAMHTS